MYSTSAPRTYTSDFFFPAQQSMSARIIQKRPSPQKKKNLQHKHRRLYMTHSMAWEEAPAAPAVSSYFRTNETQALHGKKKSCS
jgi:hypothetical protein